MARKILNFSKLPSVTYFLTPEERIFAAKNIKSVFGGLQKIDGQQCINGMNEILKEFLTVKKMLGSGSFGNVYEACAPKPCPNDNSYKFAIKLARVSKENITNPYKKDQAAWIEYFILHDILNPLVEKGICINLPYLIDTFTCKQCDFTQLLGAGPKNQEHPCVIFLTELAQGGTLKDWFNKKDLKEDDYYNALFQMMAGIHSIQMHGQIWNYDVKNVNTLIYNVEPGGYWVYNILGINYYIPNRGYIVILNDFGVSQVFSPDYCYKVDQYDKGMFLGKRFAMIIDGKYSPLQCTKNWDYMGSPLPIGKAIWGDIINTNDSSLICSDINIKKISDTGQSILICNSSDKKLKYDCGIKFTPEQIKELEKLGIPSDSSDIDFYKHPEVIPPLEYRGDTQDVIRTFIGGNRYSQGGPHEGAPYIPQKILKLLQPYLLHNKTDGLKGLCRDNFLLDPRTDLAGYFINDFFKKHYTDYNKKPKGNLLSTFKI